MLINVLPILEARASSEIENIVTTADRLFQHMDNSKGADPATKEALRYRSALMEGFTSLSKKPLCTATAELVCSQVLGKPTAIRRIPGTTISNSRTKDVIYTPPNGEGVIRDLLGNWENFLHSDSDLDPLIRLALSHYQFEAIHPFHDGNGRTGRILNSLLFINENLLTLPVLYLSRYIIEHKNEYYRLLLTVTRDQAWEAWILFMIKGVEETANWTLIKISGIRNLFETTTSFISQKLPKIYTRELIDILFEQPYCRISNLVDGGLCQRQAASRYLRQLVSEGVLKEVGKGREKLFLNTRLLEVLTNESNEYENFPALLQE